MEIFLILLCAWVAWLEWKLHRADEKCDQLCHLLVHIAYGRLTIRVDRDRRVHITPTGR